MAHAQFLHVARPHEHTMHQRQATPPTDQRPASSASTHAKVCTQCGTTRTPQWREGPLGPKTLCNACGVKQFRLNKKATRDESKQRRPPTPTTQHKRKADSAPRPPRAAPVARQQGPDFLLEAARVAQESLVVGGHPSRSAPSGPAPPSRASSRPPRKAAAKALQRSLEWAHGGQWIEEDGMGGLHQTAKYQHAHVASRSMSDTSATSGITAQASDRAEEVAFEPRHSTTAHPALFGRDTQAAVDLLTLCHGAPHAPMDPLDTLAVRPTTPDDHLPPLPPLQHPAAAAPHQQYPPVSPLAASLGAHDGPLAAERLAHVVELSLPASLPADALDAVAAARDEMVSAFRGKEQADVAVRTVAKMLATKQDEARVQQQRVQRAIARFHAALQEVDAQCGGGGVDAAVLDM